MKKLYVLLIPIIIAFMGIFGWLYIKSTPQYSLYQMYQAVKAHDFTTFTKYADIDTIVSNLVDKVLEQSNKEQATKATGNEWEQLGANFTNVFIMGMKPTLINAAKSAIQKGVETGEIKNGYKPQNFVKTMMSLKVAQDGKVATITVMGNDNKPLSFKMRQLEGYWQVFDMDMDLSSANPSGAEKSSDTEGKTQTAQYGQKTEIGGGWYLTVNEPVDYVSGNRFEQPKENNKFVFTEVLYENTTNETGSFSISNLQLKDGDDHIYSYVYSGKDPKLESGDLEAGGKARGFITFEILKSSPVKSVIYNNNSNTVIFSK
jgi:hypothetical protein